MRAPYVCCPKKFEAHYAGQIGSGIPYYQGTNFQRGYGIGGLFRSLFRKALPFLVSGAKAVGKTALKTGTLIANDVLEGENVKKATGKRSKEAGKQLVQTAVKKVQNMLGSGKRYKRKRKLKKHIIPAKVKRQKGRDIFDP